MNIKAIETQYRGYKWSGKQPTVPKRKMAEKANLAGKRFGRLIVVDDLGVIGKFFRLWGCVCDCGTKKAVRSRELQRGHTQSCGCLRHELLVANGGQNRLSLGESAFNQFFYTYQKSARERGHCFELTKDEFRELTSGSCYYCGSEPTVKYRAAPGTNGDFYGNGIDRIDNASGYISDNVRSCCKQCNIAKGVLTEQEFIEWAKRVSARFEHGETPRIGAPA